MAHSKLSMRKSIIKLLSLFTRNGLNERPNLRRIISNVIWLSLDRILRLMGGLLVGIWVARYLGPEQYGLFNYVVAFVGLFGVLATLGVDQIVIHDIVKYPVDTNEIIGTAFSLKLFGSTLALGTALITMKIMRPDDTLTLTLVGIIATGLVFSSFDTIDLLFQAQVRSKYTVYAKDGAFLVIVGVKIVLVLLNAPLTAFALAGLAEIILGTSGLILFYQRHSARLRDWRISFTRAKALLQLSWPLILTGAANLIYLRIDQVMLGNMVNDTEVGIYAAAVRVSEIWYFIPTVVTSSIYPTLIKLYQDSEERFYDKLKQVMGYFFWGTLILSLLVSAFSNQIIDILYGRDYARAGSVLAIHIYAYVITSMWIVFSQKFIIDDTTKIYFYGMAAGAVSNIILNLWLLPLYGAYGAAITTVISYTMPMLFQTTLFDKRIGLTFLNSVFYPFRDIIKLINKLTH